MTCIAAIADEQGRVIMGSDSMAHNEATSVQCRTPKAFARNGVLFGCCGSSRFSQILRYQLAVPEPPVSGDAVEEWCSVSLATALREAVEKAGDLAKGEKDLHVLTGNVLVATQGRIVRIFENFEATEGSVPYDADGSGCEVALGVMYALCGTAPIETICEKALEAAAYHTPYVRAPFDYVITSILEPTWR